MESGRSPGLSVLGPTAEREGGLGVQKIVPNPFLPPSVQPAARRAAEQERQGRRAAATPRRRYGALETALSHCDHLSDEASRDDLEATAKYRSDR